MFSRAKQAAVRAVARRPVYRVLPPGGLRTYAALKYHAEHSGQPEIVRFIRSLGGIPTRRLSTALVAARALFRAGQDDMLTETLDALERRHPGSAAVRVLRADLLAFQGRPEAALAAAQQAQQLVPSSAPAAARVVKLSYRACPRDAAEQLAVAAVRRFPLSPEVLWPVAVECDRPEQYDKIQASWEESAPDPAGLLPVVRQLAVAASRAGELDAAADLYRRAIVLVREGRPAPQIVRTRLGGLGARTAIADLTAALDGARVPFFFAAGTALGLVRAGRPLGADGDIDIGVFAADWDRPALIELFSRHPQFDLDLHPQTSKVGLRHRGGSPVDIFRFYPQDGQIWHDGVFVRWCNSPFEVTRREVDGVALPLPDEVERYLTENYGDWRTPNPDFDAFTEDAPNVEVTWPDYQRVHFLRRAYEAVAGGDNPAAARDLRRAGEPDLAAQLG